MNNNNQTNAITTMHRGGYEQYGRKMIRSFLEHWPANARLTVYAEDFTIDEKSDRLEVLDLHESCPELVAFKQISKEGWKNGRTGSSAGKEARVELTRKYNFKFDAVKFANKVFSYCAHAGRTRDRFLVWLDADTLTERSIPSEFIETLGDAFVLYLGRRYTHSECGFLRFDMHHSNAPEFFRIMRAMYETGEIYTLNEWHDSFVFDTVRSTMTASGVISAQNIADYEVIRHPFIHSQLGRYMDHLKGDHRKALGSSTKRDRGLETLSEKVLRKLGLSEAR